MHSGNPHGGALLPFEIFALITCPMTFSSAAFLTPSHAITLPFSKHFPQGNTSCSALETVTPPRLPVSADLAWSPASTQPASLTSLRKRWKAAQQKDELHLDQHISCAISPCFQIFSHCEEQRGWSPYTCPLRKLLFAALPQALTKQDCSSWWKEGQGNWNVATLKTATQTLVLLGLRSNPRSDHQDLFSFSLTSALPLPHSLPRGCGRGAAEGISLSQGQSQHASTNLRLEILDRCSVGKVPWFAVLSLFPRGAEGTETLTLQC